MEILLFSIGTTESAPAIEAAKIAAETASRNAIIATVVSFLTVIASIIGIVMTRKNHKDNADISKQLAESNLKSLDKRRLIDTISAQRIGWINNTRSKFVEFNELCHSLSMVMFSYDTHADLTHNYDFDKQYQKIAGASNHIELLLNPREFFSDQLINYAGKMIDSLTVDNFNRFNIEEYKEARIMVAFIQQVILKAEWQRIKTETERGEQISAGEMNGIFEEVAKEIDIDKYEMLVQSAGAETD